MSTTSQKPEVALDAIGTHISTSRLSQAQAQRAWCVGFCRIIWPTIQPTDALKVARWMMGEAEK